MSCYFWTGFPICYGLRERRHSMAVESRRWSDESSWFTHSHSRRLYDQLLHVYLHREPHSSGPFDMQLVYEDIPQESGSYQCKRICKRIRDMDTNMAVDMGDKSVYIRAFKPREISQSTSLRSIQSNTNCCMCTCIVSLSSVCSLSSVFWLVRGWCFV